MNRSSFHSKGSTREKTNESLPPDETIIDLQQISDTICNLIYDPFRLYGRDDNAINIIISTIPYGSQVK